MSRLPLKLSYRANGGLMTLLARPRYLFTSVVLRDNDQEPSDDKAEEMRKKKEVQNKMKDLLLKMTKNVEPLPESAMKISIPQPRGKAKQRQKEQQIVAEEKQKSNLFDHRLEKAAKDVAKSLGGDTQKTQMELLDLYLTPSKSSADQKSFSDLLSTMKIEKQKSEDLSQRSYQVKSHASMMPRDLDSRIKSRRREMQRQRVDIFGELPFNIFVTEGETEKPTPPVLETWDYLHKRDLQLSVTHPPQNIFEQLILWTEQGKIWKFPINNEQDWPEDENVDFAEHVFLERHIESWCPKSGPVRQFMELVCIGLSKNPFQTVVEKKAHIAFFEHYFRLRNTFLKDAGIGLIPEKSEQEAAAC